MWSVVRGHLLHDSLHCSYTGPLLGLFRPALKQCSAEQCSAFQFRAVQCSAVQCSAVHFNSRKCSTVQYSIFQCSAVVKEAPAPPSLRVLHSLKSGKDWVGNPPIVPFLVKMNSEIGAGAGAGATCLFTRPDRV